MKKLFVGALCAVSTTVASANPAAASDDLLSKLYEGFTQEYWIWAYNQPIETNPLLDNGPFCKESKSGGTVFFSGSMMPGAKERSCDIKAGQWLYLSALSSLYIAFESDPAETKTPEAMLEFATCAEDATATVTVDGYTFDASKSYTETGVFDFPVYEGGLLEAALGGENTDGALSTGIHVVLPPLSPGEHTISWHAESLNPCGFDNDGDGVPDEKLIKDFVYHVNVKRARTPR